MVKKVLTHNTRIAYALTEVLIAGIVSEATELVLDCLRERRGIHVRVLRPLAREFGVEVRNVQDGLHTGLERGLDFLRQESAQPDQYERVL